MCVGTTCVPNYQSNNYNIAQDELRDDAVLFVVCRSPGKNMYNSRWGCDVIVM